MLTTGGPLRRYANFAFENGRTPDYCCKIEMWLQIIRQQFYRERLKYRLRPLDCLHGSFARARCRHSQSRFATEVDPLPIWLGIARSSCVSKVPPAVRSQSFPVRCTSSVYIGWQARSVHEGNGRGDRAKRTSPSSTVSSRSGADRAQAVNRGADRAPGSRRKR